MSQNIQNMSDSQEVLKVDECSYEFNGKMKSFKMIHKIVNNLREVELCFDEEESDENEDQADQTEDIPIPSQLDATDHIVNNINVEEKAEEVHGESGIDIEKAEQQVENIAEFDPDIVHDTEGIEMDPNQESKQDSDAEDFDSTNNDIVNEDHFSEQQDSAIEVDQVGNVPCSPAAASNIQETQEDRRLLQLFLDINDILNYPNYPQVARGEKNEDQEVGQVEVLQADLSPINHVISDSITGGTQSDQIELENIVSSGPDDSKAQKRSATKAIDPNPCIEDLGEILNVPNQKDHTTISRKQTKNNAVQNVSVTSITK